MGRELFLPELRCRWDDRNVRISPVETKGCVALRCPYSEPFSASVLHGSSFLIASACLFFHSVSPQSASLVLWGETW